MSDKCRRRLAFKALCRTQCSKSEAQLWVRAGSESSADSAPTRAPDSPQARTRTARCQWRFVLWRLAELPVGAAAALPGQAVPAAHADGVPHGGRLRNHTQSQDTHQAGHEPQRGGAAGTHRLLRRVQGTLFGATQRRRFAANGRRSKEVSLRTVSAVHCIDPFRIQRMLSMARGRQRFRQREQRPQRRRCGPVPATCRCAARCSSTAPRRRWCKR